VSRTREDGSADARGLYEVLVNWWKDGDGPVDQVMAMAPYRSAPRVFWIVDNGSSHQGAKSARRLRERYPNLILVHTPPHASWLNQIEVFFSIVPRKVLTPAVADSLAELQARILTFEAKCRRQPRPVRWKFSR
jgi:hypothetical protein